MVNKNKKSHQELLHYRIYEVARIIACVSFVILATIGVSSLVFAMTLSSVPDEEGIPTAWQASTIKNPETITVPITYWDQRVDACDDEDRQFEWGKCHYWTKGALQGIVKDQLGSDGLPVPTFSDSDAAWEANHDIFTANVTGHDPVLPTDNFYRWFHEVEGLSKLAKGYTITFNRNEGGTTYTYGGQNIYPLDSLGGFDAGDVKLRGADGKMHNFHFTGHLRVPIRITASGLEKFQFSGDDDVWVFLNNQLVLDIGGLHEALSGWFMINPDGTVDTHINSVSNVADRTEELTSCMKVVRSANSQCNTNFNNFLVTNNQPANHTLNLGLKAGDVVYLDFFYAERSSDGSNTKITIENMDWPISADAKLSGEIVKELENTNIAEYQTSLTNRDPEHSLQLERIASYIKDAAGEDTASGFIPLSSETLYYTTTPEDDTSWKQLSLSAPADDNKGFSLETPLTLTAYGTANDTVYFRYFAETIGTDGVIDNVISYYTGLNGTKRIAHADTTLTYEREAPVEPVDPEPVDPVDPDPVDPDPIDPEPPVNPDPVEPDPVGPEQPVNPTPVTPSNPVGPTRPTEPEVPSEPLGPLGSSLVDDGLIFIAPLGEVAYVPNTGIVGSASGLIATEFASVVLSQSFVMAVLLTFAISFALFISLRKHNKQVYKASRTATVSGAKVATGSKAPRKEKGARAAKKAARSAKPAKKSTNKGAGKVAGKKAVADASKKKAVTASKKTAATRRKSA